MGAGGMPAKWGRDGRGRAGGSGAACTGSEGRREVAVAVEQEGQPCFWKALTFRVAAEFWCPQPREVAAHCPRCSFPHAQHG